MKNDYELIANGRTAGLEAIGDNINAYNDYGMTPTQVALQAGAEAELAAILSHPDCKPMTPSRSGNGTFTFVAAFQVAHGGSNPFTGAQPASQFGSQIDQQARRMWQAVQDASATPFKRAIA